MQLIIRYEYMKYNLNKLLRLFSFLLVFFLSLFLAPYYYSGDQVLYNKAYEHVRGLDIWSAWLAYDLVLKTSEIVHFIFIYVASPFISKNLLMSFINGVLAYYATYAMQLLKTNTIIIFWTITLNYYFLVLYFAAERLKFAFLFIAIAFCWYVVKGMKSYKGHLFTGIAILSHIQILAFCSSFMSKEIFHLKTWNNFSWRPILIIGTIGLCISLFLYDYVIEKIMIFFNMHDLTFKDIIPIFILLILSFRYSNWNVSVFFVFLPIIIGIILIGGDRLNMMGYFIFLYYACQFNKGINIGMIALSGYFTYKSYVFFEKILQHGNGFS